MTRLWLLLAVLCAIGVRAGEAPVYSWRALHSAGDVVTDAGQSVLRVENKTDAPATINVLTIEHPPLAKTAFALRGRVRCENVAEHGYLEMWTHIPGTGACFSRTLGEGGPMGYLAGQQSWRDTVLPFDRTGTSQPPSKLVVNVVLPGRGVVFLTDLTLVEGDTLADVVAGAASDPPVASRSFEASLLAFRLVFIPGLLALSMLLTVAGIWLATRGIGRTWVLAGWVLTMLLAALGAALGIVSMLSDHKPSVYLSLLLVSAVYLVVAALQFQSVRRSYAAYEVRRMSALDTE